MRELLIATHNEGKAEEFRKFFAGEPFSLLTMDDADFEPSFRVDEVGKTFAEMTLDEKTSVDHRGKALKQVREIMLKELVI